MAERKRTHFGIIRDPKHARLWAIASDSKAAEDGGGIPMAGLDRAWVDGLLPRLRRIGTVDICAEFHESPAA